MISYYQPFLFPFLKLSPNPKSAFAGYYYHSFEDALWDLIDNKFPPKKQLTVLVPDFYCSDVLDNLKARGHQYIYYPLDSNFQIPTAKFKQYISTFSPDLVIIFHACGITSQLLSDTSWLSELSASALIVEDSVHRLVNPSELKLLNDRHFVIDSLRKVSPLPGSRLFGNPAGLNFPQSSAKISLYQLSSYFYYILFRLVFVFGLMFNSYSLVTFAHHTLLKRHDDIIGDSVIPHPGLKIFLPLIYRLNYQKISQLKSYQVGLYEKYLNNIKFRINSSEAGKLHVYPLIFPVPPRENMEKYLQQHRLPVWFKFTDTPWSQTKSVLFLPLGFHINEDKIRRLAYVLSPFFTVPSAVD